MKKDAYYFPHDANAKDDPKIILLMDKMGMKGYGIYWVLIETLRDQANYKCSMDLVPSIARRYNSKPVDLLDVIRKFDLFIEEGGFFYSPSLSRRMQVLDEKRKKLSDSGKAGNDKRWGSGGDRVAIGTQSHKIKEDNIKENNSKVYNGNLNETELKSISEKLNLSIDSVKSKFQDFKKVSKFSYPDQDEFMYHFQNWLNQNLNNSPVEHKSSISFGKKH